MCGGQGGCGGHEQHHHGLGLGQPLTRTPWSCWLRSGRAGIIPGPWGTSRLWGCRWAGTRQIAGVESTTSADATWLRDEGFCLAKQLWESRTERGGGLVQGPHCRASGDMVAATTLGPPSSVCSYGKSPVLLLARGVGRHETHRKKRIFWQQVQKHVPPSLASPPNPATPRHLAVFS